MPMKDSKVPDEWIAKAVAQNQFQKMDNGLWRTCPVRLAFCHVMKPNPQAKNDDGTPRAEPQYEVTMLCPPGAQEQINGIVWPEVYRMLKSDFAGDFDANGQPIGLHIPWRDQHTKAHKYSGYTSGLPFLRATTKFKPQVVDTAMNPIVDESRVYAGVWAIVSFNLYTFGKNPPRPKKGVSLSFSGIMLVADDQKLAGGAPDAAAQFKGVQVDARFDPSAQFGAVPGSGVAPPPSAFMPPPAPVSNYAPPAPPGSSGSMSLEDMMR